MTVPTPILEGVRQMILRLTTAFPATPKVDSPDPGDLWFTKNGDGPVIIIVNKTGVRYVLSVRDLTAGVDLATPACPPPPAPSSFKLFVSGLISGHDYRVRIEVDPADVMPNDEFNTIFVTAV